MHLHIRICSKNLIDNRFNRHPFNWQSTASLSHVNLFFVNESCQPEIRYFAGFIWAYKDIPSSKISMDKTFLRQEFLRENDSSYKLEKTVFEMAWPKFSRRPCVGPFTNREYLRVKFLERGLKIWFKLAVSFEAQSPSGKWTEFPGYVFESIGISTTFMTMIEKGGFT